MGIWAAVKYALNSTLGTSNFLSLDKMIQAHGTQTFTSDGTFTVPASVHKIFVTACGGGAGGSGAGGYGQGTGAGGNGGACIIREPFSVTPGQTIGITIGIGGAGGSSGTSSYAGKPGKAGTATIIGSLVTLPGGDAGDGSYVPGLNVNVGAGRGGTGKFSDSSLFSKDGDKGVRGAGGLGTTYTSSSVGGGGGGSYGNGGSGACGASPATKPGYGGGGGGGNAYSYSKTISSDGGNGIVIIEW